MDFSRLFEKKFFGMVALLMLSCWTMTCAAMQKKDIAVINKGENPIMVLFQYKMKNPQDTAHYVLGLMQDKGGHVDYLRKNEAGVVAGYLEKITLFCLSWSGTDYGLMSAFVIQNPWAGARKKRLRVRFDDSAQGLLYISNNDEPEVCLKPTACGCDAWDTFLCFLQSEEAEDDKLFNFEVVGWICSKCQQ